MKNLIMAVCVFTLVPCVQAYELTGLGAGDIAAAGLMAADIPEPTTAKASAGRYETVYGSVHLSGKAIVPEGMSGGYVMVTLTGTAFFSAGDIKSNKEYITIATPMWLKLNQPVNHNIQPSLPVVFYRDGEFAGKINVTGPLNIYGTVDSKQVTIFAQGVLSGSLYVEDKGPGAVKSLRGKQNSWVMENAVYGFTGQALTVSGKAAGKRVSGSVDYVKVRGSLNGTNCSRADIPCLGRLRPSGRDLLLDVEIDSDQDGNSETRVNGIRVGSVSPGNVSFSVPAEPLFVQDKYSFLEHLAGLEDKEYVWLTLNLNQ